MTGWWKHAACRNHDPDLMQQDESNTRDIAAAKRVCAGCPVRLDCLTYALDRSEPCGVWGGYTAQERRRYAAGVHPKHCPRCGLGYIPRLTSQRQCSSCSALYEQHKRRRPVLAAAA